jgi:hypothetical protein
MALTDRQLRRLESIKNYHTRYEALLIGPDGQEILLGYTSRKSRRGLLEMLRRHPDDVLAFVQREGTVSYGRQMINFSSGWRAVFSGRTERDAILLGEKPFITECEKPAEAPTFSPTP